MRHLQHPFVLAAGALLLCGALYGQDASGGAATVNDPAVLAQVDATWAYWLKNGHAAPAGAFGGSGGLRSGTASDDFNRPNSTLMGPDWTERGGDLEVFNNTGRGALASGWSYMTHNSASCPAAQSTVAMDLMPPGGSSGPHVAAIMGFATAGTTFPWLYTKIQDNNSDGFYDRIFWYSNGNGGGYGSSFFQDLTTPVNSGTATWVVTGDNLVVSIVSAAGTQTFTNNGVSGVGATGSGHGVGTWAMGSFDNYELNGGGCTSPTLAVTGATAGGTATATVNCATAGGAVVLGYSLAGGGPVNVNAGCAVVTVSMSPPINQVNLTANAGGTATFTTNVPPGTTGVNVWTQAFDAGSCALTTGVQVVL